MPELVIPKILKQASCLSIDADMTPDASLYFNNRFKSSPYPNKTIKFMVYHGDPGMAPMTHRGVQAPTYKGGGMSEVQMQGALINEKIFFNEEEVNDCMAVDPELKKAAQRVILERIEDLSMRNDLRRDWLASQAFFNDGVISYTGEDGTRIFIDYKIPSANKQTFADTLAWGTGGDRDPAKNTSDMKRRINRSGGKLSKVFINTTTLNTKLRDDTKIQTWVKKSDHPMKHNIFTNPLEVMKEFLDIPLEINDDFTSLSLIFTGKIDSTHFSVNDATALKVGTEIWLVRVDGEREFEEEAATIKTVSGNVVETTSAVTGTFIPNTDLVKAEVPYLADNKLVFAAEQVRGKDIIEWKDAPLGLGKVKFGKLFKTWPIEDPDNILTRCQRLGIWCLRHPKAIGSMIV